MSGIKQKSLGMQRDKNGPNIRKTNIDRTFGFSWILFGFYSG